MWVNAHAFGGAEDSIFCADSSIRSTQGEINKKGAVRPRFPSLAAGRSLLFARNSPFQPQNYPLRSSDGFAPFAGQEAAGKRGRRLAAKLVSAAS